MKELQYTKECLAEDYTDELHNEQGAVNNRSGMNLENLSNPWKSPSKNEQEL